MSDPRPDELLQRCGMIASRNRFALAWSDGLTGEDAKRCSRNGWKQAQLISVNEGAAAGFYRERARRANPAVVASKSKLVLVECDGGDELLARFGISLPVTLAVRSRRGVHRYLWPPAGKPPLKIQVAEDGVTVSKDGYLIGAGALHPTGWVYRYLDEAAPIVELPIGIYEQIVALDREHRAGVRRLFAEGEPIPKGDRNIGLFWLAVDLLRTGMEPGEALERILKTAREQCCPPLEPKRAREQFKGAVKFVREHPTETEKARAEARRVLRERSGKTRQETPSGKTRSGLFFPFADVRLSGPPRWLWRGKIPVNAVTLLAGRPKLGKSLLSIWIAAQLSRGLLEGGYDEPARTLIIAAEDPPDPIVKGRLIAASADQALVGTLASRPSRPSTIAQGNLDGLDGAGAYARRITIPDEYELLEEIVVENAIALVVLDPINSFITHKVDAHRDAEIRRVLDPLAALSARRRFSSLAVVHLNRRSDTDILNRITGSSGYGGSARSILTFGRHPEDDMQRVVAAEGNWQKEAQSKLFELREVIVFPDAAPEEQTQPALVHIGVTDLESSDLIDRFDDDRSALDEAKDYLLGELALGAVPVADIRRGAEANGHSWPTVERAKKLLGVEARRISTAGGARGSGRWEWFLELVEKEEPQE
jgi:hypothetical protein